MSNITIKRYSDNESDNWDSFVRNSKMPLFMFYRKYMDYHKDRFKDHSLMFYNDKLLLAVLPMCETGKKLISHAGLTYGGFISGEKMKQGLMLQCFDGLLKYANDNSFESIVYKTIPMIFWKQMAEEDQYALMRNNANLIKVEASTVINLNNPCDMSTLRKRKIKQAQKSDVLIHECQLKEEYDQFLFILNEVLFNYHGVNAVHTSDELFALHRNFPDNIKLYVAKKENRMIAGTVLFIYDRVVHTQYLASNEEGRMIGALDYLVSYLIDLYKYKKKWFDFGISTENGGRILNEGLISQKEGFGGRTLVYKTWDINPVQFRYEG